MVMIAAVLLLAVWLPQTESPVRTINDGVLDKIVLYIRTLDQPEQIVVDVKPFDVSEANLGTGGADGKGARQQEAKHMQTDGPRLLAEHIVLALKGAPFKAVAARNEEATAGRRLVVEGRFVQIDPGSRAKRYFVGFGAGKSSVKVEGTVKDGNGRVLATFEQRRIGAIGMGGGDSLGKLMSDTKAIGEDIGKFLARWSRGERID